MSKIRNAASNTNKDQILKRIELDIMPADQYCKGPTVKNQHCWHLTAGGPNGHGTIAGWTKDNRGKVGTTIVIEGPGPNSVDGRILQCVPWQDWIYHLGLREENFTKFGLPYKKLNRTCFGTEVCNYGPLTYKNGKFYAYGHIIPKENAIELDEKVYGHRFWQDFSDRQLDSMTLIAELMKHEYGIDPTYKGDIIFEMNARALSGEPGHWTHRSFQFPHIRCDVPPLPKIVERMKQW